MKEIWREISGYEKMYLISNCGRVKSLTRYADTRGGGCRKVKERILKYGDYKGYKGVVLSDGHRNLRTFMVAHLVWDHFGGEKRDFKNCQVDHIDNNPLNNHIDNLQLLTHRENVTKGWASKKRSGLPCGVKYLRPGKFQARITVDRKQISLGVFNKPREANIAYNTAFANLFK